MKIEYRLFRDEDAEILSRFTKQFLDPRRPSLRRSLEPEYYLWRNHRNPAGPGKIFLAWDGDRLAGCFAYTPKRVHCLGQIWRAAEMDDAFVHPQNQGLGVFRYLVEMAAEEAGRQGIQFFYGTPNEISYPVFLHRLKFVEPPHCHVWLVMSWCAPFRFAPLPHRKAVLSDYTDSLAFAVLHSEEYLHWRFSENPDHYDFLDGCLVLKEGLWGRWRVGYLADQLTGRGDRSGLLGALQVARRHFARRGLPLLAAWVQTSLLHRAALLAHGFLPLYRKPVIFRSLDPSFNPLHIPAVHFLMADSDNI